MLPHCVHIVMTTQECCARSRYQGRAGTSNYIPQLLWDVITCPCLWYHTCLSAGACIHIVCTLLWQLRNVMPEAGMKGRESNYIPQLLWDVITCPCPSYLLLAQHSSAVPDCPACRTSLIATRFWVVMICPIIKCLTVLEFSFILFDLCLFITIFNFILNYVPIVTFWILTYHKIWILLIIFCFIWSYWIIYFLTCLEVFWSVVS